MIVSVQPAKVSGKINVPASKSSMQRACAAALLTSGTTVLSGYGDSNDEKAASKTTCKTKDYRKNCSA